MDRSQYHSIRTSMMIPRGWGFPSSWGYPFIYRWMVEIPMGKSQSNSWMMIFRGIPMDRKATSVTSLHYATSSAGSSSQSGMDPPSSSSDSKFQMYHTCGHTMSLQKESVSVRFVQEWRYPKIKRLVESFFPILERQFEGMLYTPACFWGNPLHLRWFFLIAS